MTRRSNRHDVMTPPLQRRAAARARSKCGRSAWPGDKALRLQWRAAPTCTAHAALARKRCPARSCMIMSETPLPTLALGRSAKRALRQASRSARSARRLRHPHHQEATRTFPGGGQHVGARARSAHAIGAERAARGRDWAAAGARARSAHAIGAERVARAVDGSQRLRRPAHGRAAPSARSAVRRAPSA